MPNSDEVWKGALDDALDVLQDQFKPLLEEGYEDAKEKIQEMAKKVVKYWKASQEGDRSANIILGSVKRQANLIIARYTRRASERLKETALQIVEIIAQVGLVFLKRALG